ncbi:MAG: histidinol-phosphate transaminase [Candidatus Nitricoxidivorans perseverans]|uniref:Histidinol-phosphate aminotransferase n=1 Tax=Candidatus Nitricoxidivorans perseverans TaxID=2975601 RepID=A0AA49FL20_9PROT|nr:MAG: histidinol-phosphate transaminase [Candidatus Nitricoxidivorans perseverans]
MSRFWNPLVASLSPYVPGEQPKVDNLVKLNTNENPYGPSPRAVEAIRAATDDGLRLYPDPTARRLREAAATFFGIAPEQVFAGNGSDEVLAFAFLGLLRHAGRPLLFPDVTYSFYPVYCGLYGIEWRQVPLDDGFGIRVADYCVPNGGIIFPNPNAPTGRAIPRADIEWLLERNRDSVVVVDEAYVDFGGESAVPLIDRFPNLLVVQTLSKSRSLAGLRVGLAMGHPDLIECLVRLKDSFNSYPLDRLALAGATAALEDREHFEKTRRAVMRSRGWLAERLARLGFAVLPSAANFVFCRPPDGNAAELAQRLRENKVLVRHFKGPRTGEFLRITVGTDEQCAILVNTLEKLLS